MLARNNSSDFAKNPQLDMKRSAFERPTGVKTSFNAGDLIPMYVEEILPGDTVTMPMSYVVRESTPIYPVMDNSNLETFWFFVPNRLLWDDWEHFITGGLDAGAWDAPTQYEPPTIRPYSTVKGSIDLVQRGFPSKSLADYMGIPVGKYGESASGTPLYPNYEVSALPFRAYAKIWNDWFRSSSIQKEVLIPKTGGSFYRLSLGEWQDDDTFIPSDNASNPCYGVSLLKANKYHDYFTSALQEPQRGEAAAVPVEGVLPVTTIDPSDAASITGKTLFPLKWQQMFTSTANEGIVGTTTWNTYINSSTFTPTFSQGTAFGLVPQNLVADGEAVGSSLSISINDLRHAAAVQHILEIDARSGSGRYIDLLLGHFGVSSPDGRLQRSEYLGGTSVPINMDQVLQTSSTDSTSPQGNTAAYSLTAGTDDCFTKSFTEHGILMCLVTVRYTHTYQQGLNKKWSRKSRYDYYWPSLANISEQAILNKEIFCGTQDGLDTNNQVFGYQEAWAEYRYSPSIVTSTMRSSYPQSLDVWHYADVYNGTPNLSADWLLEDKANIARTLASQEEDQFIADFYFKPTWYRVMPVYSIPGLDRI